MDPEFFVLVQGRQTCDGSVAGHLTLCFQCSLAGCGSREHRERSVSSMHSNQRQRQRQWQVSGSDRCVVVPVVVILVLEVP